MLKLVLIIITLYGCAQKPKQETLDCDGILFYGNGHCSCFESAKRFGDRATITLIKIDKEHCKNERE